MYQQKLCAQQPGHIQIGFLALDAHLQQLPLLIASYTTENFHAQDYTLTVLSVSAERVQVSYKVALKVDTGVGVACRYEYLEQQVDGKPRSHKHASREREKGGDRHRSRRDSSRERRRRSRSRSKDRGKDKSRERRKERPPPPPR